MQVHTTNCLIKSLFGKLECRCLINVNKRRCDLQTSIGAELAHEISVFISSLKNLNKFITLNTYQQLAVMGLSK